MPQESGTKRFTVTGGALIPDIPPGSEAVCAKIQPRQGDFIAYVIGNGEPVFRRYRENGGRVILESLNAHFDSFETTREELESRGTVYVILSIRKVFRSDSVEESPVPVPEEKNEQESDWLTFSEASKLLKVKRTKMYAMLRSGTLRASKIGKLWRIARPSIEKCLMENIYKPGKGDPE